MLTRSWATVASHTTTLVHDEQRDGGTQKGSCSKTIRGQFSPYGAFKIIGGVSFTHCPLNIMGKEYGGKNCEIQIANDATNDIVFGHTHKYRDWKAPKIGDKNYVRIVNVGCALPFNHVEEYAKLNLTGWSWGIVELGIWDNHIQESKFISMDRLEKENG